MWSKPPVNPEGAVHHSLNPDLLGIWYTEVTIQYTDSRPHGNSNPVGAWVSEVFLTRKTEDECSANTQWECQPMTPQNTRNPKNSLQKKKRKLGEKDKPARMHWNTPELGPIKIGIYESGLHTQTKAGRPKRGNQSLSTRLPARSNSEQCELEGGWNPLKWLKGLRLIQWQGARWPGNGFLGRAWSAGWQTDQCEGINFLEPQRPPLPRHLITTYRARHYTISIKRGDEMTAMGVICPRGVLTHGGEIHAPVDQSWHGPSGWKRRLERHGEFN